MAGRRSASERNQQAVDGGLWHQEEICKRLARWRSDPIGWGIARSIFGAQSLKEARVIEPRRMLDAIAKPDLAARWISLDGEARSEHISAKLIASQPGASLSRPVHHAGRVRFEVAQEHGILPDDPLVAGWILEHFIDGEPLSARAPEEAERALEHFRAQWARVARAAIGGQDAPRAGWLLISMAQWPGTPDLFLGDAQYVPIKVRQALAQAEAEAQERALEAAHQNARHSARENAQKDAASGPGVETETNELDEEANSDAEDAGEAFLGAKNESDSQEPIVPRLVETRILSMERAVEILASEPPTLSRPRESQVGSIGSRLMLVQRGQARSLGPQRDIQVKICAGALFEAAGPLPKPGQR